MALQDKIKELRELSTKASAYTLNKNDRGFFPKAMEALPKLLDALEIQQEALQLISRSDYVNIYENEKFVKALYRNDMADEVIAKVNDLFK